MNTSVTGLSWFWIGVALTVPTLLGFLVALPIWKRGQPILGNIAGSIVIFGSVIAFILREHAELEPLVQACLDRRVTCWPEPSAFARYVIYAAIGLVEVIALFSTSLHVETRLSRKGYAPEWR
jgi:hypothetical protein